MTTAVQTAKMIYPSEAVAKMILGKMVKRYPERKYTIVQVSSGHQVVGIKKLPDYMPPHKPAPVNNKTFASADSQTLDALVFEFPYQRETKAWWYFDGGVTGVNWIHKNHVISYEIVNTNTLESPSAKLIRIKVSEKIAKKTGLVKEAA